MSKSSSMIVSTVADLNDDMEHSRIDIAYWRQEDILGRFHGAVRVVEFRMALLLRFAFAIPLHEWAEAVARGNSSIDLLIEAHHPVNAGRLIAEGRTPRCPPWASRRYRACPARVAGPLRKAA